VKTGTIHALFVLLPQRLIAQGLAGVILPPHLLLLRDQLIQ
jgi:hypothetical protein